MFSPRAIDCLMAERGSSSHKAGGFRRPCCVWGLSRSASQVSRGSVWVAAVGCRVDDAARVRSGSGRVVEALLWRLGAPDGDGDQTEAYEAALAASAAAMAELKR